MTDENIDNRETGDISIKEKLNIIRNFGELHQTMNKTRASDMKDVAFGLG